jgi:hypothetical protein
VSGADLRLLPKCIADEVAWCDRFRAAAYASVFDAHQIEELFAGPLERSEAFISVTNGQLYVRQFVDTIAEVFVQVQALRALGWKLRETRDIASSRERIYQMESPGGQKHKLCAALKTGSACEYVQVGEETKTIPVMKLVCSDAPALVAATAEETAALAQDASAEVQEVTA